MPRKRPVQEAGRNARHTAAIETRTMSENDPNESEPVTQPLGTATTDSAPAKAHGNSQAGPDANEWWCNCQLRAMVTSGECLDEPCTNLGKPIDTEDGVPESEHKLMLTRKGCELARE